MNTLGLSYEYGIGQPVSYELAGFWFRSSAYGGNPLGMASYAFHRQRGLTDDADLESARKWYALAAMFGDALALSQLSAMRFQEFLMGQEPPEAVYSLVRRAFLVEGDVDQIVYDTYDALLDTLELSVLRVRWEVDRPPSLLDLALSALSVARRPEPPPAPAPPAAEFFSYMDSVAPHLSWGLRLRYFLCAQCGGVYFGRTQFQNFCSRVCMELGSAALHSLI